MSEGESIIKSIAILGGTGKEGRGLAYRWARAGYRIVIGSRQLDKALAAAEQIIALVQSDKAEIIGMLNEDAARVSDLCVLTVPFSAHVPILESLRPMLQGKILIDVTVPLVPPKVTRVQMPPDGSAAQEAQRILGDGVRVVAAFQNISYENLLIDEPIDCDVLVCGGNKEARQTVIELIGHAGMVAWDAGVVENSVVVEGLTSILIGLNKQFNVHAAGIKLTGLPRP